MRHGVGFTTIAFTIALDKQPLIGGFRQRRLRTTVGLVVFEIRQVDGQFAGIYRANCTCRFASSIQFMQDGNGSPQKR